MKEIVSPEELLYRAVKPIPVYWKDGRITSALFKDSKGVSVDRDGGRSSENIISNFVTRMGDKNVKAIAILKAEQCFNNEMIVIPSPVQDNKYHAEIHCSETKVELSKKQARALANCCQCVALQDLEDTLV